MKRHHGGKVSVGIAGILLLGSLFTARAQDLDALFDSVARYDYGSESAADLEAVAQLVLKSHGDPLQRGELVRRFCALLQSDATLAAKQFACKQLYVMDCREAVPCLEKALLDEETADMARYVLERMPDAEAGAALRRVLGKMRGAVAVGIINSLGERREPAPAGDLARLSRDPDPAVAEAAIAALGKIGGSTAIAALSRAKLRASPELRPVIDDALLQCAAQLNASGSRGEAEMICEALYRPGELPQTRAAALKGLAAIRGGESVEALLAALNSIDPIVVQGAADALREVPGSTTTQVMAAALPTLAPQAQVWVLRALRDRGDPVARSAVVSAGAGDDAAVRHAALDALGALGDASCVSFLARAAVSEAREEAEAARNSLIRLRGPGVNEAMLGMIDAADPATPVLMQCLAERNALEAIPSLLLWASSAEQALAEESLKALGALASPADIPSLVQLLLEQESDSLRLAAESALAAAAKRGQDTASCVQTVLAVYPTVERNPAVRCSLIRVLSELGEDAGLEVVRRAAKARNAQVREAAVRALSQWPNAAPLEDLLGIARRGRDKTLRTVSLRAFFRLLALPSDRPPSKTVEFYKKGLRLASSAEEKRLALAGLAQVRHPDALKLIESLGKDKELEADVRAALEKAKESRNR